MDVALVEHAEHDVDGHDRREDEPSFVARATLETPRPFPGIRPGIRRAVRFGARHRSTALTASPSDARSARLNDSVAAGNCPWWLTVSGVLAVVTVA